MKSLEKDRVRRYGAASGLALDIERHLQHRPVSAHAPSTTYRLRKFLRRNRLQVAAICAVVVVLATVIISSIWSRHQVRLAEAEAVRQASDLAEARRLVRDSDLTAARKILRPILESKHVGLEARTLFADTLVAGQETDDTVNDSEAIMERHYRERVRHYTERITKNPNDPDNYLRRAQQYQYLGQEQDVQADMIRYMTVLWQGQDPMLLFGAAKRFRPVMYVTSRYQFVLSAARRESGIVVMSIAFGQKGRGRMKSFEIPMFLASLFGACFITSLDTPVVLADFTIGAPTNLESVVPIIDPMHEGVDCLSTDGLEMYIESDRAGGQGGWDFWVLRRSTVHDDWGPPENLGPNVNSPRHENTVSASTDGLMLLFASTRSGGYGGQDIYMTTRPTRHAAWGEIVNMGPRINSPVNDFGAWMSADGLELYFTSNNRVGGYGRCDVYVARRASDNSWGEPQNLGSVVNSAYDEMIHSLSPDGRVLFFCGYANDQAVPRPGGYGGSDMWMTRRETLAGPWQTPVNLGPKVNSVAHELAPRISPDGSRLYFSTNSGGTWDNWLAPVIPIVDFNGDGEVDGKEVLAIVEHLNESESLYDIGPSALGDGSVDINDLIVLADYIGTEHVDSTLVAHWPLDEGAGSVAIDRAGDHYAMIVGDVVWEPNGVVGGALAFDGGANFMRTVTTVLDPAAGPCSVIAWVKGGAPNQVIVSQVPGADWLYLNQHGMLTTDLKASGQDGTSLTSDAWLLDEQWHRAAVVWDGTNRALRVDGVEVATDTQPDLAASSGSLQIGAGKSRAADTFWSGLMDDIRVYRRAVKP